MTEGKEIAEAGLIAYYDYVMRDELTKMMPRIQIMMNANPEIPVDELKPLTEQLMKNINTRIAEDYKAISVTVINDLGRRIGEIAKTI